MLPIILCNTFPLSFIRRSVMMEPRSPVQLREAVARQGLISFWGTPETLSAAKAMLGFDPSPASTRPHLMLNHESLPTLEGHSFTEVWVVSPDYLPSFSPQMGQEVPVAAIHGWQVLVIRFDVTAASPAPSEAMARLDQKLDLILARLPESATVLPETKSAQSPEKKTESQRPAPAASEAAAAIQQSSRELEAFLNGHGIKIKKLPKAHPADETLDRLAMAMGDHFEVMSPVLNMIKRAMHNGAGFQYRMAKLPQASVGIITQQCKEWHRMAFLHDYFYERSPIFTIHAKASTLSSAMTFFSGQWLERFITGHVRRCVAKLQAELGRHIPLETLSNAHITLPNGDDFELDLILNCGPGLVFWVEGKTGDYQRYVQKYSKFAKTIGLSSARSFIVLTEVRSDECSTLSSLFGMTVCTPENFETAFSNVLRSELTSNTAGPQKPKGNE